MSQLFYGAVLCFLHDCYFTVHCLFIFPVYHRTCLSVVGHPLISGIALHIMPTYVTKYEAVITNMPVKAALWSAFLFLLKNFLFLDKKKSLRMFLLK